MPLFLLLQHWSQLGGSRWDWYTSCRRRYPSGRVLQGQVKTIKSWGRIARRVKNKSRSLWNGSSLGAFDSRHKFAGRVMYDRVWEQVSCSFSHPPSIMNDHNIPSDSRSRVACSGKYNAYSVHHRANCYVVTHLLGMPFLVSGPEINPKSRSIVQICGTKVSGNLSQILTQVLAARSLSGLESSGFSGSGCRGWEVWWGLFLQPSCTGDILSATPLVATRDSTKSFSESPNTNPYSGMPGRLYLTHVAWIPRISRLQLWLL